MTTRSRQPAHMTILKEIRPNCEKAVGGGGHRETEIRREAEVEVLCRVLKRLPIPPEYLPTVVAELKEYRKLGAISIAVAGSHPQRIGVILTDTIAAISSMRPEPAV